MTQSVNGVGGWLQSSRASVSIGKGGALLWCLSPYPTGQPCWSWAARKLTRHRDLAFCQVLGRMGHAASLLFSLAFTV
jgi:hypothetical protein